ncbi:MAG: patatin-like phospholipase family protein [Thermodesulfobacteriota bacterium]
MVWDAMPNPGRGRVGLVLSGGGARGAYQVGVIRGLVEHGFLPPRTGGIDLFVGSSAGAINCAALASHADDFAAGLAQLEGVWAGIRPGDVYLTDVATLGRTGVRWAWDLSLGGVTGRVGARSLLDTRPLRRLLRERIPFERLDANVASGRLTVALVATDLRTSNGVVFLHASPDVPLWTRRRWRIERTPLRAEHVIASSAIPIFFPAVEIGGEHFSDGSIRNTTPLSPAINLGAERIIAIGVSGPPPPVTDGRRQPPPTIAHIAGVVLDAVMLDAIEVDVEHSERVNLSVLQCPVDAESRVFRHVDVLWIRPSTQVRELAADLAHRIPRVVRYLLRGLGSDEAVTELVSYLLFDAEFCTRLMELGRQDVAAERDRIARFFAGRAG